MDHFLRHLLTGCERSLSCPLSKMDAKVPCVKLRALCDDVRDCPKGEDEDPVSCLFFKMVSKSSSLLRHLKIRWRGKTLIQLYTKTNRSCRESLAW